MSPPPASSRFRLVPIAFAQGFAVLCGIAGVKLNSTLIPPATFGAYGVFLTLAPVGMWIVHAGLVKYVNRNWAASPSRPAILRVALRLWARRLPWLAALAMLGALSLRALSGIGGLDVAAALFAAAALLSLGALAQGALQAEAAHWRDCAVSSVGSATRTFVPPLLFLGLGGSTTALWTGFGVHAALLAAVALWALHRYWRDPAAPASQPEIGAAYRGPLFVALAVAGWALAGLNRWVVAAFFGPTEAGYFTLAGGAAVVLASTIATVFAQYFQPGFFARADAPEFSKSALATRIDLVAAAYTTAAIAAIVAFAWAFPWLIGWLVDAAYADAVRWAVPGGCFVVATSCAYFYHALLLAGRRESACVSVDLTTAAVLVIGSIVAAALGLEWLRRWLMLTPIVPWLLTRTLARRFYLKPDGVSAPAPGR